MKQNSLFKRILFQNFKSHFKELMILILCETILVAISYAGAVGYQMFSGKHSTQFFLQEDGMSRVFVSSGMILLFCGVVLIITVLISYLGKRIPEYMLLKRMGITGADLRKMILFEAGVTYLIAVVMGFIGGTGLAFGLKMLLTHQLKLNFALGKVSILTYPLICLFTLIIYILGVLLVKELEYDFLIITNTQETTRKEKLISKFTIPKIIIGIGCCIYAGWGYSKIWNYENVLLIGLFFLGLYLTGRNLIALWLENTRKKHYQKYYKNLLQNHRFYYRPNTVSRYVLFFSLVSFLGCFYFGFQGISILTAEKPESLYPYDFMCIADNEDDSFFEMLKNDYDVSIVEYPMVRVANIDKTERVERWSDIRIQGQQIGISESTYHQLKKALDTSYQKRDLGLDKKGKRVYIVHQQDSSTKAQPLDWFYGKRKPDLHVGIPCTSSTWVKGRGATYEEKIIVGEEIGSLTGCYSTPKCENLVVFSDNYFEKARELWKTIDVQTSLTLEKYKEWMCEEGDPDPVVMQGPTKLVLIRAKADDRKMIDKKLETLEEQHKYIGNYDSTVRFHYSSETAIRDLKTERAMRLMVCIYIIGTLAIVEWIMLYAMWQMEKNEKKNRERFLAQMGMTLHERRRMNRRELYVYFVIPTIVLTFSGTVFLRDVFRARIYGENLRMICGRYQLMILVGWTLINGIYFWILSKWMEKEVGKYD